MNNEAYIDLITRYLKGTLSAGERKEFQRLLETGRIDHSEIKEMETLYHDLEFIEVPEPMDSGRMKRRFSEMLEAEKEGQKQTGKKRTLFFNLDPNRMLRAAAAAILLLAGFSAGLIVGTFSDTDKQVLAVQEEVEQIKNALVYHAYQQTSASERIRAVGLTTSIEQADDQLLMILIHTMNNDPNVNVRLASIDALRNFGSQQNVRNAFIQGLALQDHPLVQMSLINVLVDLNERNAIAEMERLLVTENTLPEIREHLLGGISELRM